MEEEKEAEVVSGKANLGLTHRKSQKHKLQIKFSYLLRPQGQPFIPYQAVIGGFPGGSESKESACNAGDLGSIPWLGRSPGERNGNPLQYCCLENPMDRGAWWAAVHGVTELNVTERLSMK